MAAAKAASVDEAPPAKGGPSMVMQVVMLLVATLLAVGLGAGAGMFLGGAEGSASVEAPPSPEKQGEGEASAAAPPGNLMVIPLAQITTNLAAPSETWVRLEASIVLDEAPEPELAEAIHQDFLAFMRTVRMHQVEGASGFLHLKSELEERAATRSGGRVKQVLIRTLLFE